MKINRIRELRKEKGLKQLEVAKFLNMSPTGYNKYEISSSAPGIETIIKLAKFYNVSIDYLVGISNNRNYDSIESLFKNLNAADKEYISNLIERVSRLNGKKPN